MTDITESQAKAIAESLGWNLLVYNSDIAQALGWNELIYDHDNTSAWWFHSRYGQLRGARAPRLTDDTVLAAAMQRDAIVWLRKRGWLLQTLDRSDDGWWLERRRPPASTECGYVGHVLEAAMIKELEE